MAVRPNHDQIVRMMQEVERFMHVQSRRLVTNCGPLIGIDDYAKIKNSYLE